MPDIRALLPGRPSDGNKGSFGRVLLVCGNDNMRGAAALATTGALRMGAGLVTVASTKKAVNALSTALYEPIWMRRTRRNVLIAAKKAGVVGIGCGMGQGKDTLALVTKLLGVKTNAPLVIDADGINVLSGKASLLSRASRPVILTPHPLEFSRLTGLSIEDIRSDREGAAKAFAAKYGVILLLKGKNTVITDGSTVHINETGNTALAKGGSGDVLTGMLCAFLAQGCAPLDAAILAAHLHGLAGERLSETYSEYGVLASELPAAAAKIIKELTV